MRHDNFYYNLLASLLSAQATVRGVGAFSQAGWQWEEFIRIAADEAVLPPLSDRLRELGLFAVLPSDVQAFLDAFAALNAERNSRILAQIEEIAGLLNSAGIEPVVLKGPAYLLSKIYENPAHRFILDIDLLIPQTRIETAFSILRAAGYSPEAEDPVTLSAHHLPALSRPDRIRIELHHSLGSARCRPLLPPAEIIERSAQFQLQTATVRIPHPSDLAVHLIVHSQIHHGSEQRVWPPLRAQYDLVLLSTRFSAQLDWLEIRERFRGGRYLGVLILHLLQVSKVFHQAPPFPLQLHGVTGLRWRHRQLLWSSPWLRFVDPILFFSSATNIRPSLTHLLRMEGGLRFFLTPYFMGRVWKKLANSFRH